MSCKNVPTGFAKCGERVFVSVQRSYGVYSTLNTFDVINIRNGFCPPLKPYPSIEINELVKKDCSSEPYRLINVHRFR